MLLLAEISNTWNRANHFYRETFHLTFFSKRVYVRRGNSWMSLSSPIKFSTFFSIDYASRIPRRNIFNGSLPTLRSLRAFHGNFCKVVSLPHFCRRCDNFAVTCSYFDSAEKYDAKYTKLIFLRFFNTPKIVYGNMYFYHIWKIDYQYCNIFKILIAKLSYDQDKTLFFAWFYKDRGAMATP